MYILELETTLLMKYKIQLWDTESKMTMLDLQSMIKQVTDKNEAIEKDQKKDNFSKCLVYLRDMLNFMTLHDSRIK